MRRLVCLSPYDDPTQPMITEAADAGFYHSPGWDQDYPKLQILTVADLFDGDGGFSTHAVRARPMRVPLAPRLARE